MQLTVQLPPIQLLAALGQRVLDDRQVDRVEDDDRVVLHAQRRGGVDPVAVPAGGAQLGEHLGGVVAALGGDDDVAALQRLDVEGVLQRGLVLRLRRAPCRRRWRWRRTSARSGRSRPRPACGPSAPSRPCRASRPGRPAVVVHCEFHCRPFRMDSCCPRLVRRGRGGARRTGAASPWLVFLVIAATTASPISRVPTLRVPSDQMSAVRRPCGSTCLHRRLDAVGGFGLVEGEAEHHGGGQDCSQRIGHALAGDVGRAAVAGLVQALVARRSGWPRAACRSSRSASPPRRTGCRRTCCR